MKYFFITISVLSIWSCSRKPNDFEKVLRETLPEISDSLRIKTINFKVNIPPPIVNKDSVYIGYDTLGLKKNELRKKQLIDSIGKINPKILLSFSDSLKIFFSKNLKQNLKEDIKLYNSIFKNSHLNEPLKYVKVALTHENIVLEKFELITFNKLEEKYGSHPKVWYGIHDRFFGGVLDIEGIIFNEEKNYGIMRAYYADVAIDGFDYIVSIERVNGKWKIKEFHNKWSYLNQS